MARSQEEPTRHSTVPIDLIGPAHWPAKRRQRRARRLLRVITPAAGAAVVVALIAHFLR